MAQMYQNRDPKSLKGLAPSSAQSQLSAFEADQPAWSPEHNTQFWAQRAQQHQQLRDAADTEMYGPPTGMSAFNKGWNRTKAAANPSDWAGFAESLGPRVSMSGLATG